MLGILSCRRGLPYFLWEHMHRLALVQPPWSWHPLRLQRTGWRPHLEADCSWAGYSANLMDGGAFGDQDADTAADPGNRMYCIVLACQGSLQVLEAVVDSMVFPLGGLEACHPLLNLSCSWVRGSNPKFTVGIPMLSCQSRNLLWPASIHNNRLISGNESVRYSQTFRLIREISRTKDDAW